MLARGYLTGLSHSALVLKHQVNHPEGSLEAPVKEDHIYSAIKIQAKHWSKQGLSQASGHAVSQSAALRALAHGSLPSYTFIYVYMHIHVYIYNTITPMLRAQHILLGCKHVYIGPPEHFPPR